MEKWVTHAHNPEGILITPGTLESVAYVANRVLVFPGILVVIVCSAAPVGTGDHCLYVGLPKALFVLSD